MYVPDSFTFVALLLWWWCVCMIQVIEAAIESGVEDVEVVEGDHEGTTWILTTPKDLMTLTGKA